MRPCLKTKQNKNIRHTCELQWFTTVILATREAKLRISGTRQGWWYTLAEAGDLCECKVSLVYIEFQNNQGYIERLYFKNKVKQNKTKKENPKGVVNKEGGENDTKLGFFQYVFVCKSDLELCKQFIYLQN